MERIGSAVTGHRKTIVVIFLVLSILGGIAMLGVPINYNITDYLPLEAQSTRALDVMSAEFPGDMPNLRVMLREVSPREAMDYKAKIAEIPGVSSVMWLDDVADLKTPVEMMDPAMAEMYYKNGDALLNVAIEKGKEASAVNAIYELLGEKHAISGDALNTATSQMVAKEEVLGAMLLLVPLSLFFLMLSTTSWLEPLVFLATIGVAVLINMGTNLFLGEISFVTQAISPILQMAVSLDYAIFLLHSFAECRLETEDLGLAMRRAMKQSFSAIAASAATTLFGFLALVFMNFRIGADLGYNLVKGIVLSFLSVLIFLPALTLCCCKLLDKTRHRAFLPRFSRVGKFSAKLRVPCLLLVLLLLVPCFLAQSNSKFTYGMGDFSPGSRSGDDTLAIGEEFGESTTIALLVPRGDPAREQTLVDNLKKLDHVTGAMSYTETVDPAIPPEYLDPAITQQFYSQHYSRIILDTNTEIEGEVAFKLVSQVQSEAKALYGDEALSCGQSVNLYDMKNTVNDDNRLTNMIAIIAITLVLLVTFRSLTLPLILLLTIEAAIWINLSVNYFLGTSLNYIGYLVINTVQLGATVDYAILLTVNYLRKRKELGVKPALNAALQISFPSILTSAIILSAAGFCLYATSSNTIIIELGLLLGRGTLLSMLLVIFLLPALLWILDKLIGKTTLHAKFSKEVFKK